LLINKGCCELVLLLYLPVVRSGLFQCNNVRVKIFSPLKKINNMKTKLLKKIVVKTRLIASLPVRLIASLSPLPAICIMMCAPVVVSAQNGVTVSNLAVNAGTVTFNVAWDRDAMPVALWSDSVWVFVDYNKAGTMERLPVIDATASAGTVEKIPGNDKGVWVVGNARTNGSFSATVQLLTTENDVGGACAYASNYPPVGEYLSATKISFTGTPMYEIALKPSNGSTFTVYSKDSCTISAGHSVQSFTDATGAPGTVLCRHPNKPNVTPNSRCGAGTVSLSASAVDAVIDWYEAPSGGNPVATSTNIFNTNTLQMSETYYAQARNATSGCVSNARTSVLAEIKPTPSIIVTGQPSQTVTVDNSISPITFAGKDATGISLTAGVCPLGLTCSSTTGNEYLISGTTTVAGAYPYTVTATHSNSCPAASASGTLTVQPGLFLTSNTYSCGGKIYSDVLQRIPTECVLNEAVVSPAAYNLKDNVVYLNYECYKLIRTSCPSGWSAPTFNTSCNIYELTPLPGWWDNSNRFVTTTHRLWLLSDGVWADSGKASTPDSKDKYPFVCVRD
jgi:hypothetical protein